MHITRLTPTKGAGEFFHVTLSESNLRSLSEAFAHKRPASLLRICRENGAVMTLQVTLEADQVHYQRPFKS